MMAIYPSCVSLNTSKARGIAEYIKKRKQFGSGYVVRLTDGLPLWDEPESLSSRRSMLMGYGEFFALRDYVR